MEQTRIATEAAPSVAGREHMNIVIVGHVDHGKSTVIGRLLADTGALPEGKLAAVQEQCRRTSKPFEYAFLIDALADEQSQGITIDSARVFFKSAKRNYIIIDAPGHIEFLKNMVTGAARAEAALLVIDAKEGVQENSRRHGYLLAMLGIRKIVVLVNKMDLVDYDQATFDAIVVEYNRFLADVGVQPAAYLPVSGMEGDNVAAPSARMPWFRGTTVLDALDAFAKEPPPYDKPFRMPVQDVYKFTQFRDDRRIVAGTVVSGRVTPGAEVVFLPSGKKSRVHSLERFNADRPDEVASGEAIGFTLDEQIYVQRGEMAVVNGDERPKVASRLRVSVFWLGREPMVPRKEYTLKLGTARVRARLEEITRTIDASDLAAQHRKQQIERHDVAECVLSLGKALAFDLAADNRATSRFVLVDDYEIRGGGIILEDLPDAQQATRESVIQRNYKWEPSSVGLEARQERFSQRPTLVVVTGDKGAPKKEVAKALETQLFRAGRLVYYLGIGSVLYGVDADIRGEQSADAHREQIRRLGELAYILLDAGMILIVTMVDMTADDLALFGTTVNAERMLTVLVGDRGQPGISYDLRLATDGDPAQAATEAKALLQDAGTIFKPY